MMMALPLIRPMNFPTVGHSSLVTRAPISTDDCEPLTAATRPIDSIVAAGVRALREREVSMIVPAQKCCELIVRYTQKYRAAGPVLLMQALYRRAGVAMLKKPSKINS